MNIVQWTQKKDFPYSQKYQPAKGTTGSLNVSYPLSSFTQFDPIKSIIVGYIDNSAIINKEMKHFIDGQGQGVTKMGHFPTQFIQHAQKNMNTFSEQLQKIGIEVIRVGEYNFSQKVKTCGVQIQGFNCFSPRDYPFVYHDSFYEFPMSCIGLQPAQRCFQWIQKQLHEKGSRIYSAWDSQLKSFKSLNQGTFLKEDQYFGDAANVLKVGLDILFSLSLSGSRGCFLKLRQHMQKRYQNKVRVHLLDIPENYDNIHLDTTFSIIGWNKKIQKYIVVVNGNKTKPSRIPAIFRGDNWALIEISTFDKQFYDQNYNYVSDAIGMNFLTINPQLIVITPNQIKFKEILDFYQIGTFIVENKHTLQFGGGFHCITNDIYREDTHKFGQIIEKNIQDLSFKQRAGLFDQKLLKFLYQKGPIDDWVKICNQNQIFPYYLTEHMSNLQKSQMESKHKKDLQQFHGHLGQLNKNILLQNQGN